MVPAPRRVTSGPAPFVGEGVHLERANDARIGVGSLLLLAACAPAAETPNWTVEDSAGVEIVSSLGPAPAWSLSAEPILPLGVVDQGGPTEFFRVVDIALLEGGGMAVANGGTHEVRLFTAEGRHVGTFGREGRGPEEFRGLSMVESVGDSLLVYDGRNDRASVWSTTGVFGRSFRLEWFNGLLFPVDVGDDGIVAVTARYMTELSGSGLVVDTALVSRYDFRGNLIDSVARLPHNERVVQRQGDLQTTLGAPFSSSAAIVAAGPGFCYAFGPAPDIRCYDGQGRLERVVRVPAAPRRVTPEHVAAFWAEREADEPGPRSNAFRRMRDFMPFPEAFPAFGQLLVDDVGRLWARRYRLPDAPVEEWLVFESGRVVGALAAPVGFRVMAVRADHVAGVFTDDLGIEFVRVYEVDPA